MFHTFRSLIRCAGMAAHRGRRFAWVTPWIQVAAESNLLLNMGLARHFSASFGTARRREGRRAAGDIGWASPGPAGQQGGGEIFLGAVRASAHPGSCGPGALLWDRPSFLGPAFQPVSGGAGFVCGTGPSSVGPAFQPVLGGCWLQDWSARRTLLRVSSFLPPVLQCLGDRRSTGCARRVAPCSTLPAAAVRRAGWGRNAPAEAGSRTRGRRGQERRNATDMAEKTGDLILALSGESGVGKRSGPNGRLARPCADSRWSW